MLTLSLFPGADLLGYAFEREGFCVVTGPDVIFGRDIREFHPPAERFDGICGGPPCQSFSPLVHLVRANGHEPRHPNLIPEFERVVGEARPSWFLMEEVPQAPRPSVAGYAVCSFLLDNSTLDSGDGRGNEQMRRRMFSFGVRGTEPVDLRAHLDFALRVLPQREPTVISDYDHGVRPADRRRMPPLLAGHDYDPPTKKQRAVTSDARQVSVGSRVRREKGRGGTLPHTGRLLSLHDACRIQGLPETWADELPFTMHGKRMVVGNGVPIPMGRALAKAIRNVMQPKSDPC